MTISYMISKPRPKGLILLNQSRQERLEYSSLKKNVRSRQRRCTYLFFLDFDSSGERIALFPRFLVTFCSLKHIWFSFNQQTSHWCQKYLHGTLLFVNSTENMLPWFHLLKPSLALFDFYYNSSFTSCYNLTTSK